jgi:hypothetical protein
VQHSDAVPQAPVRSRRLPCPHDSGNLPDKAQLFAMFTFSKS